MITLRSLTTSNLAQPTELPQYTCMVANLSDFREQSGQIQPETAALYWKNLSREVTCTVGSQSQSVLESNISMYMYIYVVFSGPASLV